MEPRRSDAASTKDAGVGKEARSSVAGGGKPPRSSISNWGPGGGQPQQPANGAPRLSATGGQGSMRRQSHRQSARNSRRGSHMGGGGDGGQQTLQVIDEDGVDRTPKPLLSVKPSVLRGMGPGGHDDTSPASEAGSEFFLDRMSSAAFSRGGGGWGSGSNSGAITPTKSDAVDDDYEVQAHPHPPTHLHAHRGSGSNSGAITPTKSDAVDDDYEVQREKAKAMAAAAAAAEQQEMAEQLKQEEMERSSQAANSPEPQELLTEKELDAPVEITLTETTTDFLLNMPCVTVSMESDECAGVEAANARYTHLLAIKAANDKYTDQEAQTLNPLMKSREIQSCVMTTTSTGCQATTWDISDMASGMRVDASDPHAAAAAVPNVTQLAGAVAHGEMYGGGARTGGWAGGSTTGGGSYMAQGSLRNMGSMAHTGSMMRASTTVMSWAQNSMNTAVPGMIPSVAGSRPSHTGSLPEGPAAEGGGGGGGGGGAEPAPINPLLMLPGLLPALNLMEMALCQNSYLPKLLQYRDITPIPHRPEPMPLHPQAAEDGAASKAPSQALSRVASRMASRQASECGSMAAPPDVSRMQSFQVAMSVASERLDANAVNKQGGGGPPPGYAASMAESAWPEEMLQDLADLGPDGVPRMEPLWNWACPLTGDLQVVCMAWNKKVPDMLAVGYGTQAFSKAAAAAGMGSGCYGTPAAPTPPAAGAPAARSGAGAAGGGSDDGRDAPAAGAAAVPAAQAVHGMVAFWSLKHPEYPLWHFRTRSGVTALDFATHQPNILAVGLYDGSVAVYDVKAQQGTPAMESDSHTGRHSDPVWKVQWIDRGHERDEPLVSISTDGRVTQWSIAKGLEFSDLMALKRVPRKATTVAPPPNAAAAAAAAAAKGKGPPVGDGDAFISRLTSGMSFDFSARDQRIYIAGTEDGWIHRCSTSYSEQYLESYEGHMGPVYALRWSPFRPNMWASASADWTLRLWQEGRPSALLSFQSGSHEVNDVQWCPTNSTVFGSVTSGGRLEVWDFGLSTVKPVITHKAGSRLSCLLFSPSSPVVVCGSDTGMVSVFRLYNIEREYDTPEEQLSRLDDVIRANVMKTQPGMTV